MHGPLNVILAKCSSRCLPTGYEDGSRDNVLLCDLQLRHVLQWTENTL